jgi:hypothetical protein
MTSLYIVVMVMIHKDSIPETFIHSIRSNYVKYPRSCDDYCIGCMKTL